MAKQSCSVCGQRRCVESTACVELREQGTIEGVETEIHLPAQVVELEEFDEVEKFSAGYNGGYGQSTWEEDE